MSVELCVCVHENDHVGKRCSHPIGNDLAKMCPCMEGMRVDIATFRIAVETSQIVSQLGTTMMRLLAVMETAAGLQSKLVMDDATGRYHVEIEKRSERPPLLIVPR